MKLALNKRVLIVDDEPEMVDSLSQRLCHEGYQVEACHDGLHGFETYTEHVKEGHPFDLVLLDVAMPRMTGLEMLSAIRNEEDTRGVFPGTGVPIIMVTAFKENFMDAFNRGCNDYLLKPFEPEMLLQKVASKLNMMA